MLKLFRNLSKREKKKEALNHAFALLEFKYPKGNADLKTEELLKAANDIEGYLDSEKD